MFMLFMRDLRARGRDAECGVKERGERYSSTVIQLRERRERERERASARGCPMRNIGKNSSQESWLFGGFLSRQIFRASEKANLNGTNSPATAVRFSSNGQRLWSSHARAMLWLRAGLHHPMSGHPCVPKQTILARAHTGPRQAAAVANRAEVGRGQAAYAVRRALCPVCARARPRVVGV